MEHNKIIDEKFLFAY